MALRNLGLVKFVGLLLIRNIEQKVAVFEPGYNVCSITQFLLCDLWLFLLVVHQDAPEALLVRLENFDSGVDFFVYCDSFTGLVAVLDQNV